MRVEVFLEHNGNIPADVDWQQLKANIQQNVDSFSKGTEGTVTKKTVPAPDTAQGEDLIIHWLIEVAKDPKMAPVYYKMFCFGVNELISLANKKKDGDKGKDGITTRLTILGKEIHLPAAVTAIEEFLKTLGD